MQSKLISAISGNSKRCDEARITDMQAEFAEMRKQMMDLQQMSKMMTCFIANNIKQSFSSIIYITIPF